jgi:hypothetical protein
MAVQRLPKKSASPKRAVYFVIFACCCGQLPLGDVLTAKSLGQGCTKEAVPKAPVAKTLYLQQNERVAKIGQGRGGDERGSAVRFYRNWSCHAYLSEAIKNLLEGRFTAAYFLVQHHFG